ncbi:MAG: hypothetical protein JF588_18900 [Caulobacterales bacterium]|nr:hypothetical protein [Caulobacterales bacterium]
MIAPSFLREGLPLAIFLAATAWRLAHELRTGVANGRFVKTDRASDPRRYWTNVSLSGGLLAAGLVLAALRAPYWMG